MKSQSLMWKAMLLALTLHCHAVAADAAKILLYHHVSSDTPGSTSVDVATFERHLKLLESEGYEVVPLQRIVDNLFAGKNLPANWVAITFDDAYRSVLTAAAPRLQARNWPFTVFASTDYIDSGGEIYLNWDELRDLEKQGASIANHSSSHDHLVRRRSEESESDWKDRVAADLMAAQSRLEAELKSPPRFFAYPYGEFDAALAALTTSLGFISFGQQSGPVGVGTNPYAIPRFPLAKGFDDLNSVTEKLRTDYLPLIDPPVPGAVQARDAPAPALRLQLAAGPGQPAADAAPALTCFVNGQPNAIVRWIDRETGRIEIQAEAPLRPGRSKYTCTAPVRGSAGAYYWFSYLWMKPLPDGSWYSG